MQLKTHAERIVVFQLQQWLRESAILLRYTYIIYPVLIESRMEVSNV